MGSAPTGKRPPRRDIRVDPPEAVPGAEPAGVRWWVEAVLDGEGVGAAAISVTFLSVPRMRDLNRRLLGRDRSTDVIALRLPHVDLLVGDVYICPAVARRSARLEGVTEAEELLRLVVHGVLHVVGHDHPNGPRRTASPMWMTQERYVRRLGAHRA